MRYCLVMTKTPVGPEGAASEGSDPLTLVGDVDIGPLLGVDGQGRCVAPSLPSPWPLSPPPLPPPPSLPLPMASLSPPFLSLLGVDGQGR